MRALIASIAALQPHLGTPLLLPAAPPAWAVSGGIGFAAGASGAFVVYPVDYVKTQRQTAEGKDAFGHLNLPETLLHIITNEGPLAAYRGLGVQIAGVAPEKTIKLLVNDAARDALLASFGRLTLAHEMLAGMTAGACQVLVTNPLEVVKVRLQTCQAEQHPLDVVNAVGLSGLARGATACVLRDAAFSLILFPLYHHAKLLLGASGPAALCVAGVLSAAPAAFLTTPMDVVKTRQLESAFIDLDEECEVEPPPLPGLVDVARTVVAEEGPGVLFSGALERVLRSAPQFGVTLAMYDVLNTMAEGHGWLPAAG
mmetsp:Transcript_13573/g.40429  ORF Transcript_13573/g.40429 Transcript_13573/m.40429 type:complete len:313 (+) Transcript_13573:162-1100(+)